MSLTFQAEFGCCGDSKVKWGKKRDWRLWEDVVWTLKVQYLLGGNALIHPGRWLPKNTHSVSSEKYCEKPQRHGTSKAQWERECIPTAPPTICHWLDKQPKPHAIGGHVKPLKQTEKCLKTPARVECLLQELWSLWETTCSFLSSQVVFKKESFHINILIIF